MLQNAAVAISKAIEQRTLTAPVILVPAYKPARELVTLAQTLVTAAGFGGLVIVDDGSGEVYAPVFSELRALPGIVVLEHVTNLGKGAALKTGLNYIACTFRKSVGVVTADADGQHAAEDILRVGEALSKVVGSLILGGRLFDGEVPLRSRLGNTATKYVMRAFVDSSVSDTQTGLRGIPMQFVPELMHTKATRYDFELEMLLRWHRQGRGKICEVPIRTIYVGGNRSSHFNPLIDSMRVYFVFLRFASVSLLTAVIDNVVFFLSFALLHQVLAGFLIGRSCAAMFNYFANKREVFHSSVTNSFAAPRYVAAVVIAGFASYFALKGLIAAFGLPVMLSKVIAEGALFFFSFVIQRHFVFSNNRSDE